MPVRVLVVDDDPWILQSMEMILEEHFDVATARDGQAALSLLEAKPFDLVLLDVMMPLLDGAEVKRRLDARGLCVPVVLLSAGANLEATARALGVDHWLAKPFTIEAFEGTIARALAMDPVDVWGKPVPARSQDAREAQPVTATFRRRGGDERPRVEAAVARRR